MLRAYLDSHCVRVADRLISLADLVGSLRAWCVLTGRTPPSRHQVVAELQSAGFVIGRHNDQLHVAGLAFRRPGFVVDGEGKLIQATSGA